MIIKQDPSTIRSYLEDSSNLSGGNADGVVIPETVEELSLFMEKAAERRTPVTVSGGGTSTTGSRVPFGGIVVSLERLNRIKSVSRASSSAVVESGVMVDELKSACEKEGLFYTSHPTEQTAFVGGTISTNASGARSFRYGPTRRYVRALKMIMANGEIVSVVRGQRYLTKGDSSMRMPSGRVIDIPIPSYKMPDVKSSAGYFAKDGMDLIDLFIGQEGTLSIIVEAEVALVKKPERILSAFFFLKSEEDAWSFSREARHASEKTLSIEYFDANAVNILRSKNPGVPEYARAAIFMEEEVSGRDGSVPSTWMVLMSQHGVEPEDTWVAMNERDAAAFLDYRHSIPETMNEIVRRSGFSKVSTDIAVPEKGFIEMARCYSAGLKASNMAHCVFGHIGECHLHVNFLPATDSEMARAREQYLRFVEKGVALGGTVSAEHGIGKIKHKYLEMMYGKSGITEMARIKKAFDPYCILGRDNIFPSSLLGAV